MTFYRSNYQLINKAADALNSVTAQLAEDGARLKEARVELVVSEETGEMSSIAFAWNEERADWQVSLG